MAERVAGAGELNRQRRSASASEQENSEFVRLFRRSPKIAVIERAKGILMFYERCSADEAFDMLRRASQQSNVPVGEIAADIVERTSG